VQRLTSCADIINEKGLFERIAREQNGRLDIFVTDAIVGMKTDGKKFRETPPPEETWEVLNKVGLRNHDLCTVHGTK